MKSKRRKKEKNVDHQHEIQQTAVTLNSNYIDTPAKCLDTLLPLLTELFTGLFQKPKATGYDDMTMQAMFGGYQSHIVRQYGAPVKRIRRIILSVAFTTSAT